jgi:hypothetical protein
MPIVFKNNAATTIANQVLLSDTAVVVAAGTGSRFPSPTAGDSFFATIQSGINYEIVEVTNRSGDILTVVRGRDGTLSQLWNPGSSIDIRIPNIVLNRFVQMNASGNVGIGTGTPVQKLTVMNVFVAGGAPANSGNAADPNAVLRVQAGAIATDFGAYLSGQVWVQPRLASNYAASYGLTLVPNGGNVGIGTSAPSAKLDVRGSSGVPQAAIGTVANSLSFNGFDNDSFYMTLASSNSTSLGIGTQQNLPLNFLVGNSVRATLRPDGNLGVGVGSPIARVHAVQADNIPAGFFSGATYAVRMTSIAGAAFHIEGVSPDQATYQPLTIGGSLLTFAVSGIEKGRLTPNGNWGFGLTNPGYPVTIAANGVSSALRLVGRAVDNISTLEFSRNDQTDACAFIQAGTDYLQFGPGTTPRFYLGSDGSRLSKSQGVTDWLPEFMCRAVANFSGVPLNGTYSRGGTLITVTMTAHGMTTGQRVELDFTTGAGTDGSYIVTVVDANTFQVTDTASGTTSGNVTRLTWLRYGGNIARVQRNGTGDYTITFVTSMPDANYCVVGVGASSGPDLLPIGPRADVAPTTSSIRVWNKVVGQVQQDAVYANVSIFR